MKWLVVLCLVGVVGCGQKRNLDRCCVDEADCAAIGLPNGSTCQPGELCRGNECVEQTCTASSECDLTAPYCENQTCSETCTADMSCPVASPAAPYCVSGGCVQCRETSDCGDRVCRDGRCGDCAVGGECMSGLCVAGACTDPGNVAYVTSNGSGTASCTQGDPCSLTRALSLTPAREIITLAAGTYQMAGTIALSGKRVIGGDTKDNTLITNINAGPVFSIETTGADVALSNVRVFGATNPNGDGIRCTAKLRLRNVVVTGNAGIGLSSTGCTLDASESLFAMNGDLGVKLSAPVGVAATIDRSRIMQNGGGGIEMFGGVLKNSFVTANTGFGANLQAATLTSTTLDFVTVAGNTNTAVLCLGTPKPTVSNSIVSLNFGDQTSCNSSGSYTDADAGGQFFFSSDYHLTAPQSFAVDRAGGGVGTLDFDGETRPKGGSSDVGADEAF